LRSTAVLAHAQVGQEFGKVAADHRPATVGVQGDLITGDALALEGPLDQPLGGAGALSIGERPADPLAGEDVQDGAEAVHDSLRGPPEAL